MNLEICPLKLGETLSGTNDAGDLLNDSWLGQIFEIPANNVGAASIRGAKKRLVGRPLKVVLLRNTSGIKLYGKRLAQLSLVAGYAGLKEVIGYSIAANTLNCVLIDPYLATSGVADDDIFLGILEGPVLAKVQTLAAGSVMTMGMMLACGSGAVSSLAAAATGGVTLGPGGLAGHSAATVASIIGRALSGRTTADTGADVLINACIRTF